MKKRRLLIGCGAAAAAVLVAVIVALIWWRGALRILLSREDLSGPRGAAPAPAAELKPLEKGEADWPCWRGRKGDGRSLVTGVRTDWSGGLKKLWEVDYLCGGDKADTWSAPVVQGNRLVVPARDEERDLVFCLDPATGELLWLGSYDAPARTAHGPGARATPYIDDDRAYTFGRSGDLVCWDLYDGKMLWRKNVADEGGEEPKWGHSSSPIVFAGIVVVQAGGSARTIAYDKMTGEVAWKSGDGPAGYAAITSARLGGARQLLVFHKQGVSGLRLDGGGELWSVPWETPFGVNATTPVAEGDMVFVTSGYQTGCELLKISEKGAEVLWRSRFIAAQHSDPFVIDGFIYGYSGDSWQNRGVFKCVEFESGEERWSSREIGWGTAVYVDGFLLCMDIRGNVFLIDPDPAGLRKVAELKSALGEIRGPVWTLPVVANGRLYLRFRQMLVCYDIVGD